MNRYIICFTATKDGKRHVHSEYFSAIQELGAVLLVKKKYSNVEIMSIALDLRL